MAPEEQPVALAYGTIGAESALVSHYESIRVPEVFNNRTRVVAHAALAFRSLWSNILLF